MKHKKERSLLPRGKGQNRRRLLVLCLLGESRNQPPKWGSEFFLFPSSPLKHPSLKEAAHDSGVVYDYGSYGSPFSHCFMARNQAKPPKVKALSYPQTTDTPVVMAKLHLFACLVCLIFLYQQRVVWQRVVWRGFAQELSIVAEIGF